MRGRHEVHPLVLFFHARKYTVSQGMRWLQGRGRDLHGGLISDNCIGPEDVARCDVREVLTKAGAMWAIPARWMQPFQG